MLTYADENARGFFKKQGFSETVLLEKKYWKGYIKDYDSASLRCCQLFPNVNYRDVESLVTKQREFVYNTIGSQCHYNQVQLHPYQSYHSKAHLYIQRLSCALYNQRDYIL